MRKPGSVETWAHSIRAKLQRNTNARCNILSVIDVESDVSPVKLMRKMRRSLCMNATSTVRPGVMHSSMVCPFASAPSE